MPQPSTLALPANETVSSPARRYFPGWTMLGIAAAAQFMSAPGQSYSVAAFKDPMRASLRLSETDFSMAYAFATLLSACLLPFVGRLVDRFGARVMLPLVGLGLGSSCFLMAQTDSLPKLYIAFGCVRSLGQGALSLVSIWLVGEWFERRRGMATAIAGIGGGLSVMIFPLLINWLIQGYGWQTGWNAMAIGSWGILVLPAIILVRDRPEDLGFHPDGIDPEDEEPVGDLLDVKSKHQDGPIITSYEDSWTVKEVLRNATFWKLLCVPATAGVVGTGLIFHQVALLGSHGLPRSWALGMMFVQAAFATLMTFPAGWATDRWPSRYILCVAMMALAAALVLVLTMPALWLVVVYALLLGLHGSILRSTAQVVWINYYGRANQGSVRGVAWSVMIFAAALGPLPLAFSVDYFGTYQPALLLFLAMPIAAAAIVWTAYPPKRQTEYSEKK